MRSISYIGQDACQACMTNHNHVWWCMKDFKSNTKSFILRLFELFRCLKKSYVRYVNISQPYVLVRCTKSVYPVLVSWSAVNNSWRLNPWGTVYPTTYAHGFRFAVLCCGYTLADFPISIRLTSLVLWQSDDCPSASKATLMNMDKYFMWIHYERLHNHNKAKHNKTVCIFLGIYCKYILQYQSICNWFVR